MNNEDKILAILESMQSDIADLKSGQAKLEAGQFKLDAGQRQIRRDVKEIKFVIDKGLWDEIVRLDGRIDKIVSP